VALAGLAALDDAAFRMAFLAVFRFALAAFRAPRFAAVFFRAATFRLAAPARFVALPRDRLPPAFLRAFGAALRAGAFLAIWSVPRKVVPAAVDPESVSDVYSIAYRKSKAMYPTARRS
jgi:hypothetical protein